MKMSIEKTNAALPEESRYLREREKAESLVKKTNKLLRILTMIAAVAIFSNVLMIVVNVILRRFFKAPIYGATEFVCYISLFTASFALGQNEWIDGNIRMTAILESFKNEKTRNIISFIVYAVSTIGLFIMTYLLLKMSVQDYITKEVSYELHFPLWLPAAIQTFGFFVMTIVMLIKSLLYLHAINTGQKFNLRKLATEMFGDDDLT